MPFPKLGFLSHKNKQGKNKAPADGGESKRGSKRKKKNKNTTLASVLDPSVYTAALSILRKEPKLTVKYKDQICYLAFLVDANAPSIGGISLKRKNDEDIGAIVAHIANGEIATYVPEDLLKNDEFLILPNEETIDTMQDFLDLTDDNLEYSMSFVYNDGRVRVTDATMDYDDIAAYMQDDDSNINDLLADKHIPLNVLFDGVNDANGAGSQVEPEDAGKTQIDPGTGDPGESGIDGVDPSDVEGNAEDPMDTLVNGPAEPKDSVDNSLPQNDAADNALLTGQTTPQTTQPPIQPTTPAPNPIPNTQSSANNQPNGQPNVNDDVFGANGNGQSNPVADQIEFNNQQTQPPVNNLAGTQSQTTPMQNQMNPQMANDVNSAPVGMAGGVQQSAGGQQPPMDNGQLPFDNGNQVVNNSASVGQSQGQTPAGQPDLSGQSQQQGQQPQVQQPQLQDQPPVDSSQSAGTEVDGQAPMGDDYDYGDMGDYDTSVESDNDEYAVPPDKVNDDLHRHFYNKNVDIDITTHPMEMKLADVTPPVLFDENTGDDFIAQNMNQMARQANQNLRIQHDSNLRDALRDYYDRITASLEGLQADTDDTDGNTDNGQELNHIKQKYANMRDNLDGVVDKKQQEIDAAFERRVKSAGDRAKAAAEADYRTRFSGENETKKENVRSELLAEIDKQQDEEIADFQKREADDFKQRFNDIETQVAREVYNNYKKKIEKEQKDRDRWAKKMEQWRSHHFKQATAHDQVLKQELDSNVKGKEIQQDFKSKIEQINATHEAEKKALESENERLRKSNKEEAEKLKQNYDLQAQNLRQSNEQLEKKVNETRDYYEQLIRNKDQTHRNEIDQLKQAHNQALVDEKQNSQAQEQNAMAQLRDGFQGQIDQLQEQLQAKEEENKQLQDNFKKQLDAVQKQNQADNQAASDNLKANYEGQLANANNENAILKQQLQQAQAQVRLLQQQKQQAVNFNQSMGNGWGQPMQQPMQQARVAQVVQPQVPQPSQPQPTPQPTQTQPTQPAPQQPIAQNNNKSASSRTGRWVVGTVAVMALAFGGFTYFHDQQQSARYAQQNQQLKQSQVQQKQTSDSKTEQNKKINDAVNAALKNYKKQEKLEQAKKAKAKAKVQSENNGVDNTQNTQNSQSDNSQSQSYSNVDNGNGY